MIVTIGVDVAASCGIRRCCLLIALRGLGCHSSDGLRAINFSLWSGCRNKIPHTPFLAARLLNIHLFSEGVPLVRIWWMLTNRMACKWMSTVRPLYIGWVAGVNLRKGRFVGVLSLVRILEIWYPVLLLPEWVYLKTPHGGLAFT